MKYKIDIKDSALKTLEKIDGAFRKKIIDRIRSLSDDPRPHGTIKLSGEENSYRTRVGKYHIIYEIQDSKLLILVINIDHRKDVYR